MTRKLTPARLDEIEATAKKASSVHGRGWHSGVSLERDTRGRIPARHRDAKLIAMMDPATTLALVAEVRELRAKVERVETQARQVLDKHSDGPYGLGASDQAFLTIKALGEEA